MVSPPAINPAPISQSPALEPLAAGEAGWAGEERALWLHGLPPNSQLSRSPAQPSLRSEVPVSLPHHQLPLTPYLGYFEKEPPPLPSSLLRKSWAVSTLVSLPYLLDVFSTQ